MKKNKENDIEKDKLLLENKERLKELACINQTNQIVKEGKSVEETLRRIVLLLPQAWQFSNHTVARILFDGKEYTTPGFRETEWLIAQNFESINTIQGKIEVYYLKEFPNSDEGPFLKEERNLINNLATIIENNINTYEAKRLFKDTKMDKGHKGKPQSKNVYIINPKKLLQKYLNLSNANIDIFHDLMPFKVKEILLFSTLYDAFSIEREGLFAEQILGEYNLLNLTPIPRITGVSSVDEALEELHYKHFDMIIFMVGSDKVNKLQMGEQIKKVFPYIPIYLLLNNDKELSQIRNKKKVLKDIDRIFIWNGDSSIFFTMVKQLEDRTNLQNDTEVGMVKVILVIDDSEKDYSRFLPLLYSAVIEQSNRLTEEVSTDDLYKVIRLRARPKIILVSNFEEAKDIFDNFRDSLLCVFLDIKFERNGEFDESAGFKLIEYFKNEMDDLPIIIQSSDQSDAEVANQTGSFFINKSSENLIQEVKLLIRYNLGFGSFVFTDKMGRKIAVARTLKEFENQLDNMPDESLFYHGKKNHFSLWFMARGEIRIAKMIFPIRAADFKSSSEYRSYLKSVITKYKSEVNTGRVIHYEESNILDETNIVRLGSGFLGGKGRGLAFINNLIYNINLKELIPGINIRTPITLIIGSDEFDMFMELNNLQDEAYRMMDYNEIKRSFINASLSYNLEKKVKKVIELINGPIAVRSSSLFEDSALYSFSGVFDTYLLPNNHPDDNVRYIHVSSAIKMVYASIFSQTSRKYFEAAGYNIEEEKMAVILQEVVGNHHGNLYYPHVSGSAQSYNFYPVAHMKPEEGFANIALGLGKYVVEGEKTYRFSPKHPTIDVHSNQDIIKNSQVDFYALNMENRDLDFIEAGEDVGLCRQSITEAEKHGTLKHLTSVYDANNDRLEPGLSATGPRILNFSNILKYDYTPLAKALDVVLNVFKETVGGPVEIEFAVDLSKDKVNGFSSLYLLQMKPLFASSYNTTIDFSKVKKDNTLLYAEKSMGNGIIDDVLDLIYVKPDTFDKTKTMEIADEIDRMNERIVKEKKNYVLIGPGRWGTRDHFIGIPVNWTQISNAKMIVEISLEDFPLDASMGSHFFHNVTSMNIGYSFIQHTSSTSYIVWEILEKQSIINEGKYVRHIRFNKPLLIVMDGKKRISIIQYS